MPWYKNFLGIILFGANTKNSGAYPNGEQAESSENKPGVCCKLRMGQTVFSMGMATIG